MIPLDLPNKKGKCREGSWVLYRGREGLHRNERELWSFTAAGGVELFIKPPNLNDISDISEDFDHLLEDMGYQGKHLPKIPKTVGFWQVEVADVRGEFPSDAKEMGDGNITWKRGSKVVGKIICFFFWAEVAVGTFSWELRKKLKNVVLNLLDFMDEITSIVRHEMRVPRGLEILSDDMRWERFPWVVRQELRVVWGLKILSVRIRWERLPWLFVIWV